MILIVDDQLDTCEPLRRLLTRVGYSVQCLPHGRDALQFLSHTKPDLILLDLMMPHVDGLSFLRSIRSDPRFGRVPVILVTATDTPDHLAAAQRLGIADCLLKASFTVPELLERIARTLHPN